MKLRAGLLGSSHGWRQLLCQEGLASAELDILAEDPAAGHSVIVVARPPDAPEREALETYLRGGGAVLGYAGFLDEVGGLTSRAEWLEYITSDGEGPFGDLSLLDLGVNGRVSRESKTLRTQQNVHCAYAGGWQGGHVVLLPFDAGEAMTDQRAAAKSFYSPGERLPGERVSFVAKGEIRHLVRRSLEYLHCVRGIPYVHLWYFPGGKENILLFRVDTDAASKKEIDALADVARRSGIGFSWFIDIKSHQALLSHFLSFVGHELGVHCYEHRVFDSYGENYENLRKAKEALRSIGILEPGIAAPYGNWNRELARAIDDVGFAYSSEFSAGYDTLPFYPAAGPVEYRTLQVPIHPICPGSLRQAGFTVAAMEEYSARVVGVKHARREPFAFYHHPSHGSLSAVWSTLQAAKEYGAIPMLMGEFARWWKDRASRIHSARLDGPQLLFEEPAEGKLPAAPDIYLRIVEQGGREALTPLQPAIDIRTLDWKVQPVYKPPTDIRRIREFDPRSLLAQIHNAMKRRLH